MLRAAFASTGSRRWRRRPRRRRRPPSAAPTADRQRGGASPQAATPVSAGAGPSTGGFIQADPATNSLIITAPEPLYRQVRVDDRPARLAPRAGLHREHDRRGRRATTRPTSASSGKACWARTATSTASSPAPTSARSAGRASSTCRRRSPAPGSTVPRRRPQHRRCCATSAAPTRWPRSRGRCRAQGNTNIVSTPNLITLDNEEAKIVVGENVPFITGQFTNTGTGDDEPVPDHRAQGRRHHAAHQAADRRRRHGAHDDLPGAVGGEVDHRGRAPATPGRRRPSARSNRPWSSTTAQILVLGGLIEDQYTDNQVEGAAARRHPVLRRACSAAKAAHEEPHQPDGLPAPDRHARRRQREQALARPLRPDPGRPAGRAAGRRTPLLPLKERAGAAAGARAGAARAGAACRRRPGRASERARERRCAATPVR